VAVGGLALYLSLLVTITFYLRKQIGMRAFRLIHLSSLVAFFGAALHGLMAGTDSPLPAARFLYFVTFISVVFLTAYWLIAARAQNLQRVRAR
jgi:predicted ferric reductase